MTQAVQPPGAGIRLTPRIAPNAASATLDGSAALSCSIKGVIPLVDPSHRLVCELGDQPRIDVSVEPPWPLASMLPIAATSLAEQVLLSLKERVGVKPEGPVVSRSHSRFTGVGYWPRWSCFPG